MHLNSVRHKKIVPQLRRTQQKLKCISTASVYLCAASHPKMTTAARNSCFTNCVSTASDTKNVSQQRRTQKWYHHCVGHKKCYLHSVGHKKDWVRGGRQGTEDSIILAAPRTQTAGLEPLPMRSWQGSTLQPPRWRPQAFLHTENCCRQH